MSSQGFVYDLSHLTRDKSADRRITWRGFDMPRRVFWLMVATSIPALVVLGIGYNMIGIWAIVPVVMLYALVYLMFESRSSDDLRQRKYKALYDKASSNTGKFLICNTEIHPDQMRVRTLRTASLPVRRPDDGKERPIEVF